MDINEDSEMDFGYFRPWKYESYRTLVYEMYKTTVTYRYRITNVFGSVLALCTTEDEANLICSLVNEDYFRSERMEI